MTTDISPNARTKVRVLPAPALHAKPVKLYESTRTQWLRGGREPAIVVTNEAGELVYTVHRAIHCEPSK